MASNNRLQILTPQEINDIYRIPEFSDDEREYFFNLDSIEKHEYDQLRTSATAHLFSLQLAYFKVKRIFFSLDSDAISNDVIYLNKLSDDVAVENIVAISPSTKNRQQRLIMKIHGYRSLAKVDRNKLALKADYCASISIKPSFIFRELLKYLRDQRIVLPSHSTMQDLIGSTLQKERKRVDDYFQKKLTKAVAKQLDDLIDIDERNYSLTKIKKDSKDFSHNQIKGEIKKRQALIDVYEFAKKHLPKLGLSSESVRYYASLVDHYSMKRLSLLPKRSTRLYLTCFAHYKVQKANNNLLKAFIYLVDSFIEEADELSKDAVYNHKISSNEQLISAAEVWDLFVDEQIQDRENFGRVRTTAFSLIKKERFPEIKKLILDKTFDRDEFTWIAYESLASKFKKNLRVIFNNIDFMSMTQNHLNRAISKARMIFASGKSFKNAIKHLPMGFVSPEMKKYIAPNGKIIADRYEFFLYSELRKKLDSGDVYSSESIDFKSFDDDLIPKQYFSAHKRKLLKNAGLKPFLLSAKNYLDNEAKELHQKYIAVNKNLEKGTNENLTQVTKKDEKRWQLKYTKCDANNNQRFFNNLPQADIYWVMRFVESQTQFSNCFNHMTGKPDKPDLRLLFANIIGLGINAGISKMAKMSCMTHSELINVFSNFMSLENIRKATDALNNATAKFSTFSMHAANRGMIHSSSDGQKFETRYPTMKSRYSQKYFGLKKGVSAYSLVIQGMPVNAMVIGSNEHESHFVFDIIYNNRTDIQSDQHSTDSHGIGGCQHRCRLC